MYQTQNINGRQHHRRPSLFKKLRAIQAVIPTDQRERRNLQLPFLPFLPALIASAQSPYQATFSGKNSANNSS
jgi:hypothetical protein